jgi:hypothetical protein
MSKIGLPADTWSAWAATGSAAAAYNLHSASTRGVPYLSSSSSKTGSAYPTKTPIRQNQSRNRAAVAHT